MRLAHWIKVHFRNRSIRGIRQQLLLINSNLTLAWSLAHKDLAKKPSKSSRPLLAFRSFHLHEPLLRLPTIGAVWPSSVIVSLLVDALCEIHVDPIHNLVVVSTFINVYYNIVVFQRLLVTILYLDRVALEVDLVGLKWNLLLWTRVSWTLVFGLMNLKLRHVGWASLDSCGGPFFIHNFWNYLVFKLSI